MRLRCRLPLLRAPVVCFAGLFLFWRESAHGIFYSRRGSAIVFAAVCLLSAVFSPFDFSEIIIWAPLTQLLLVMILIGVSRFGYCRKRYFIVFGISITILGVICIFQKLGINVLRLYPEGTTYYDYPGFLGTIGNVDTLTAPIGLAIPLLGLFVKREAPYNKLYLIPLFFSSLILTLGGAESALLGVAVISVVAPAFLIRSMRDLRRILGGAALALVGGALGNAMRSCITGVFAFRFELQPLVVTYWFLPPCSA